MKADACAVLWLIAMAVCLDSVSSDEEGSGSSTATSTCNWTEPEEIENKLDACVVKEGLKILDHASEHANSTEDYRQAAKKVCGNVPNLRQCLEGVVAATEGCLGDVEKTRLLLNVTFIETTLEVTCQDGGINAAVIDEEQRKPSNWNATSNTDVFSHCKLNAMSDYDQSAEPNQDPNNVMKYEYHIMRDTSECLQRLRGQGHDTLVEAALAHWSNVADRMKCVDIQSGAQVLCKTIFEQ